MKKVTKMAYGQVRVHGMNSTVGPLSFGNDQDNQFGKKPYSKKLSAIIDQVRATWVIGWINLVNPVHQKRLRKVKVSLDPRNRQINL